MICKNITPVILVKNDCFWLPYTLTSIAGYFDKMVIYDVGSTDGTTDIIDWFTHKEKNRTEFFVRKLPDCPPEVQGCFRNSMIAEAETDMYLIVDGDEVYNVEDVAVIPKIGDILSSHESKNPRLKYVLFRRIEVSSDLTQKYNVEREHHRLYHRSAIWQGTHPGEVAVYPQNRKSELDFRSDVRVLHLHNTLRSPKEAETQKRIVRKSQKSYHPGELASFNILKEFPILQRRIADFPVTPALERLWENARK